MFCRNMTQSQFLKEENYYISSINNWQCASFVLLGLYLPTFMPCLDICWCFRSCLCRHIEYPKGFTNFQSHLYSCIKVSISWCFSMQYAVLYNSLLLKSLAFSKDNVWSFHFIFHAVLQYCVCSAYFATSYLFTNNEYKCNKTMCMHSF